MHMKENQLEITIIIISHNTRELTLNCLESIYQETTNGIFEIILVDNGSTDNTATIVAAEYPQVRLFALKKNLGYGGANNFAARYARGKYLLLLNPDTVVLDNAIEKLCEFAQQEAHSGIWGGRTLYPDGSLNPTCCYGNMTPWSLFCRALGLSYLFRNTNLFNPETYGAWSYDTVRKVDIITGCFFMIKRDLWQQLGGFDPLFFMYGEEADLCLRSKNIGVQPMFTPDAEIIHYGGMSETSQASRSSKVLRAKTTLIRKHWPKKYINFGLKILVLYVASRTFVTCILSLLAPNNYRSKKENWAVLWRARKEWLPGFELK